MKGIKVNYHLFAYIADWLIQPPQVVDKPAYGLGHKRVFVIGGSENRNMCKSAVVGPSGQPEIPGSGQVPPGGDIHHLPSLLPLPLLTVRENVCLPMEMQGIPENVARIRAAEALVKVGIEESKHKRFPSALSGGEQQRVAIARGLCSGAPVLLADEPTGNLDGENTKIVMEILRRLAHEEGRCVIVVTHDPEAADTADLVLRMKDGVLTAA